MMFLKFLRKIINPIEDRIKGELFMYEELNEDRLVNFWSKISGIPKSRFNKTIILKQKNFRYKPNPLGTFKVRYSNKEHFIKLRGIIDDVFGGVA